MSIKKEPQNLFSSTHVLSIMGFCYFTVISPAIDKYAEGRLNREDTIKTLNGMVYALLAASLKMFDKDVYTPKLIPGRSKDKAFDNINDDSLPTTSDVKDVVVEAVKDVVTNNINNLNSVVGEHINSNINALIPNDNSLENNIVKAVLPNILDSYLEPIVSDISNNTNNIADLFKTSNALKKDNQTDLLINKNITYIILTAKEDTIYKFEAVDSSNILDDSKKIEVASHRTINIDSYDAITVSNHIAFKINDKTLYAYIPHVTLTDKGLAIDLSKLVSSDITITPLIPNSINHLRPTIDECDKIYGTTVKYALYNDFIKCLDTFNINTPTEIVHFMAHTAHESGGLQHMKELGDYAYFSENYDYREDLGNNKEGDGARYSGVSPLQMTGRANYQAFADYINDQRVMEGVDYVAAHYQFSPTGFWWFNNDMSNFINNQEADIYDTTRRVNGGLNGIEDRIYYFNLAKELFSIA